jgi:hypothetical protein
MNELKKIKFWLTSMFICFSLLASFAQVAVYPAPEGVKSSNRYEVAVQQNGLSQQSFVYLSSPLDNDEHNAEQVRTGVIKDINKNEMLKQFYFDGKTTDINAEQSVAWTCFSFSGEIEVVVKNKKEAIRNFKILPSSAGIAATIEGNSLKFRLSEPRKLAVVINGDYLNPLFLFADAPEVAVPDKNAAGTLVIKPGDISAALKEKAKKASVLWFEPGVHQIGVAFEIFSNQTIYLAGGAYLIGTLHGMMASNVSIRGRGVLSGDSISREKVFQMKSHKDNSVRVFERMKYHAINMLSEENRQSWNTFADYPGKGCDNLNIEGITIASPRQFFIRAHGVPITVHNVKMVGSWPYNTDGFSGIGQANTTIYDCFFHCNDDAIYVSPNYCNVHHCTFWQGNNGCVFQFSWGGSPTHHKGGYIHDCDIIHNGHVGEANNRMIFGSRKSGPGDISDIWFKNIRIEGPVWSLFRLETNGSGDLGSIYNIRFENITVNGPVINKNRIKSSIGRKEGETSKSWIKDISFKNVIINGKPLTKDDIEIGDFQVENILFE